MAHYLLSAAGADRPGFVAQVSAALFAQGCNLEDSAMTRLQGEFAMLVIFSAPADAKPDALAAALKDLEKDGLRVFLKPLAAAERNAPKTNGRSRLVTVYGSDRPGIVSRVTETLAKQKFNITDLATHRTEGASAGYILYVEGEAPETVTDDALTRALSEQADGLTVSVKALDSSSL